MIGHQDAMGGGPTFVQKAIPKLKPEARGWLRHLWRKAITPDDWSRNGEPLPWWDRKSGAPMLSFPRFDLSESSYGILLLARKTPAWREVYTRILDELIRRHTTYWAAIDWLTQIGPDPDRARYPKAYRALIPKDLWGKYDVPGWTANGIEPWGLQPDPIGSPGNLFFRGFFTLMLAIHRAVSGEATWDKPFDVTGLDDRTFSWTHRGIAEYMGNQWANVPGGPHCENTKVWPFCLSAAALGLQLTDATIGTRTHWVYERWVEETFKKKFLGFDSRSRLKWVAMYYDPVLDRIHGSARITGLFPSIYVVPQNRELGELLYRNAVASIGWDKRWMPVLFRGRYPRGLIWGLLMAREYGDHTTARRLERKLAQIENARFFDSEGRDDRDEYGYFFQYREPYPRGQESALYMLKHLLDGEGEWGRAFNDLDTEKFDAPTVTGTEYPKVGFSVAWNDPLRGVLKLETFAATKSARGDATRFRVRNLRDAQSVHVLRDDQEYGSWRVLDSNSIEVETTIGDFRFEVATGYRGGRRADLDAGASGGSKRPSTVSAVRREPSISEIVAATSTLSTSCPCCASLV
jgi:linalool dehydratase/isomerase-like protein